MPVWPTSIWTFMLQKWDFSDPFLSTLRAPCICALLSLRVLLTQAREENDEVAAQRAAAASAGRMGRRERPVRFAGAGRVQSRAVPPRIDGVGSDREPALLHPQDGTTGRQAGREDTRGRGVVEARFARPLRPRSLRG